MKYILLLILFLGACAEELPPPEEPKEFVIVEVQIEPEEIIELRSQVESLESELELYKFDYKQCQKLYIYYDGAARALEHINEYVQEEGIDKDYVLSIFQQYRNWLLEQESKEEEANEEN